MINEQLLGNSLDVLTLASDQQTLSVHNWNHGQYFGDIHCERTQLVVIDDFAYQESTQIKHSSKVLNVVPGDFTHSGKLDLLVMSEGKNSKEIDMYLYQSIPNAGFGRC